MKRTMKSVIAVGCCAVFLVAWGFLPASATAQMSKDDRVGMSDAYYFYPMVSKPVGAANLPESKLGPSKAYYLKNPATVEDVEKVWGEPVSVKSLDNGKEERYYKYSDMGNLKVRAFVVQKGKVVASGLATAESAQGSEPVGEANLAEAKLGLSKAYYAKHPTTLKDVEERWGKPIAVKKLKNGKEERYYKHVSPSTGYRAFLVQDGKVVASGITNIE